MAKFETGKKVLCIKSHSNNKFERGKVYELIGKKKGCSHFKVLLDIGVETTRTVCCSCDTIFGEGILWADSKCFVPYDETLSEFTSENILDYLEISEINTTFAVTIKN